MKKFLIFPSLQVEVKVAQTKEALALQAGKTRVAYGQNYSNGWSRNFV